jgi:hypothetical protein
MAKKSNEIFYKNEKGCVFISGNSKVVSGLIVLHMIIKAVVATLRIATIFVALKYGYPAIIADLIKVIPHFRF